MQRLSLPVGLQLLLGAALVYYAFHGWDRKYNVLGGSLAGSQTTGSDTPATTPNSGVTITPRVPPTAGGPR